MLAVRAPPAVLAELLAVETDSPDRPEVVDLDAAWSEALDERDAFFQRFFHLLVVQRVRGAVDQAAPVHDGGPAPLAQHFRDARRAMLPARQLVLFAHGARMGQELLGDLAVQVVPAVADRILADPPGQLFVPVQELFDLRHIVGEGLGRRIDRGQAASDHHHRQPQLQIGDRVGLGREARPDLLPVDDVVRAIANRARLQRGQV